MAVDTGAVLHVLAHELRTPTGIAQGYIRLLLEDRLRDPADQRRAFEQMQKALGRIAELSHQSTALAGFLESNRDATGHEIAVDVFVDRIMQRAADDQPAIVVRAENAASDRVVRTFDESALFDALMTMVRVTGREARDEPCAVVVVTDSQSVDLFIGAESQASVLALGPHAADAGRITLERGGLGLALVHAMAVLSAHDAECWTVSAARHILGVRLPLYERAHQ